MTLQSNGLEVRGIKSKLYIWDEYYLGDYAAKHSLCKLDQKAGKDWNAYILLRSLIKSLGWNKMKAEITYKDYFSYLYRVKLIIFSTRQNKNCDYVKNRSMD